MSDRVFSVLLFLPFSLIGSKKISQETPVVKKILSSSDSKCLFIFLSCSSEDFVIHVR